MAVSRTPGTLFCKENQAIDFSSQSSLEILVTNLIADFKATIRSSKFSTEENQNFFATAIHTLKTIPASSATLEKKYRLAAAITLGSLILSMAYNDDRYGAEAKFGNQLLFPSKKLVQIEEIAKISRFKDLVLEQILAVGEKAISREIAIIDMRKVLFPGANLDLLLQHYLPEPSNALELEDATKPNLRASV